ncbi:hypothetical protein ACWDSL_25960 [Streptomyces sp. NPDC000941]
MGPAGRERSGTPRRSGRDGRDGERAIRACGAGLQGAYGRDALPNWPRPAQDTRRPDLKPSLDRFRFWWVGEDEPTDVGVPLALASDDA